MTTHKKAGSSCRLQKPTGKNQTHKASSRSAKATTRKAKSQSEFPSLKEAVEVVVEFLAEQDPRIKDKMLEIWGAKVPEPNIDNLDAYKAFANYIDGLGMADSVMLDAPCPCEPVDCNQAKRKVAGKPKSRSRKSSRAVNTKGGRK